MPVSSSLSVLIVRLDAIGDALVTVPLVAALRGRGHRVGAVLRPANAEVFASGVLDAIYLPGEGAAEAIASGRYDVALIPSEEPEAYALARDARIRERIGFEHGLWGKPFKSIWIRMQCTRTIYRSAGLDTNGRHECELVYELGAKLLQGVPIPRDPALLRPAVLDAAAPADPRVAFQVTDKWERMGVPLEEVAGLATMLAQDYGLRCIGSLREIAYCERFTGASGLRVEPFATLAPWKAAIGAARALVAPDSGAVHVAGMTGTPVAAVYPVEHFVQQINRWRAWASPSKQIGLFKEWPWRVRGSLELLLSEPTAV